MFRFFFCVFVFFSQSVFAEDVSLTIDEYDTSRSRVSLLMMDQTPVPMNTVFRVFGKNGGQCLIRVTEKVNDRLVGATENCDAGVVHPGMKLAYSPSTSWERAPAYAESRDRYSNSDVLKEILDRTTLFLGHNFSSELEGNVYADGSVKDLDGDTAFSMGIKGRIYDITQRVSLSAELGYETPRTLDQATFRAGNSQTVAGTQGFSPRLSLWSIAALADVKITERLMGFGGLNVSIPSLGNSPFSMSGDIGFQGGANYQLFPQIALEGLIKISNMNLKNNLGETTDVSLAGLELRGRYSF
ncbi:MAG: hypothetical protein AAF203_06780 [Pseudomonadota bacterium]